MQFFIICFVVNSTGLLSLHLSSFLPTLSCVTTMDTWKVMWKEDTENVCVDPKSAERRGTSWNLVKVDDKKRSAVDGHCDLILIV